MPRSRSSSSDGRRSPTRPAARASRCTRTRCSCPARKCLRDIAAEYRASPDAPVRQEINTQDTDHVAALREAADLLPNQTTRSAVIFFTDGQHDPPGTARDDEDVVAEVAAAFEARARSRSCRSGWGRRPARSKVTSERSTTPTSGTWSRARAGRPSPGRRSSSRRPRTPASRWRRPSRRSPAASPSRPADTATDAHRTAAARPPPERAAARRGPLDHRPVDRAPGGSGDHRLPRHVRPIRRGADRGHGGRRRCGPSSPGSVRERATDAWYRRSPATWSGLRAPGQAWLSSGSRRHLVSRGSRSVTLRARERRPDRRWRPGRAVRSSAATSPAPPAPWSACRRPSSRARSSAGSRTAARSSAWPTRKLDQAQPASVASARFCRVAGSSTAPLGEVERRGVRARGDARRALVRRPAVRAGTASGSPRRSTAARTARSAGARRSASGSSRMTMAGSPRFGRSRGRRSEPGTAAPSGSSSPPRRGSATSIRATRRPSATESGALHNLILRRYRRRPKERAAAPTPPPDVAPGAELTERLGQGRRAASGEGRPRRLTDAAHRRAGSGCPGAGRKFRPWRWPGAAVTQSPYGAQ